MEEAEEQQDLMDQDLEQQEGEGQNLMIISVILLTGEQAQQVSSKLLNTFYLNG
jgi:hypothetical protein